MTYKAFLDKAGSKKKFCIYGAGIIAYNIWIALKDTPGIQIQEFLVSGKPTEKDIEMVGGQRVYEAGKRKTELELEEYLIIVATPEEYHREIEQQLLLCGFKEYCLVDAELEYEIMKPYFSKNGFYVAEKPLSEELQKKISYDGVEVYMAQSIYDRKLTGRYALEPWIKRIQAGAALSAEDIADYQDDTGVNISNKNKNYSELTVTYWVWKNVFAQVKGLFHYRRMLKLTDYEITQLYSGKVDVFLPFPFVCPKNTMTQINRYVTSDDFQTLMRVIGELNPEYREDAELINMGAVLYNYNILVARNEVFNEYCAWLFPILERCDELCNPDGRRSDRYIGYLGEICTSIYFLRNRNRYHICHSKKVWMT